MASSAERPSPAGPAALSSEDRALLERVAARLVELRLEVPAILALETGKPLSVLAGQTLYFFQPIVTALLPLPHYRRFADLVQDRDALEVLAGMIESRADAAHRERRAAAESRRAADRARRAEAEAARAEAEAAHAEAPDRTGPRREP